MASSPKKFRLSVPRPQTFLGIMSLQTGVEMIALSLLFNKVTGLYGILAIFTGYELTALQISMYIYSIIVLVALAFSMPHIRKQTPLQNLCLAWLYVGDTVVNTVYTAVFGVMWYLKSSLPEAQSTNEKTEEAGGPESGIAGAIDSTTSITLIVAFTLVRVYFSLVVMAYAQLVLTRHVEARQSGWSGAEQTSTTASADSPFAKGTPEGDGWKGKMGRAMFSVARGYWAGGVDGDRAWTTSMKAKFSRIQ